MASETQRSNGIFTRRYLPFFNLLKLISLEGRTSAFKTLSIYLSAGPFSFFSTDATQSPGTTIL